MAFRTRKLSGTFELRAPGLVIGVKTCDVFLVQLLFIVWSSLFSLFYVSGELHRFLHRG